MIIASCSGGAKEEKGDLNDKKVKLEKLKSEKTKVETEIKKLEEEIAKLDPASENDTAKACCSDTGKQQPFYTLYRTAGKSGCAIML